MSALLNKLIAESFKDFSSAENPGALFAAQKELEKRVIDEICLDEAARIDEQAKELGKKRKFQEGLREIRVILLQCFLLAFLVGLLVSHVYDVMKKYLYEGNSVTGFDPLFLGTALLGLACFGIAFWIVVSKVYEVCKSVMQSDGDE